MRKTRKKKKPGTRKKSTYTTGELNRMIDSVFHPLMKRRKGIVIVDGVFHAIVEKDLGKSLKKFVKYSLLILLDDDQTDNKHEEHKKQKERE